MSTPVRPTARHLAAVPAPDTPKLELRLFTGQAFLSTVKFTLSSTPFPILFSRLPKSLSVDPDRPGERVGTIDLDLGDPFPPSEMRDKLRERVFDSTIAECYGLPKSGEKLAQALKDPRIAWQRKAYVTARESPFILTLPQTPGESPNDFNDFDGTGKNIG